MSGHQTVRETQDPSPYPQGTTAGQRRVDLMTALDDASRGFVTMLLFSLLAALSSACEPLPPRPDPAVRDGGLVELDENTEPRFVYSDRTGSIGILRVAGNNVFVNGDRVTRSMDLPNNALVSTGLGSGARIDFLGGPGGQCRIGIEEFRTGRLYAETQRCLQQVGTPEGGAQASTPRASIMRAPCPSIPCLP